MEKSKAILLLATILVLLAGVASASDMSNCTVGADALGNIATDASTQEDVAVQEQSTSAMDVQKNRAVKSDENIREEKTLKTVSSFDVETYQELHDALTNLDDEYITVNIKDNIKLEGTVMVESVDVASRIYVTINGDGKTVDGDHKYYFMNIRSPLLEVTVNNLTINNCTGAASLVDGSPLTAGGAIRNYATLILNNTRFTGNNAELYGGAIWNFGTLIVDNSEFDNNTLYNEDNTEMYGGAIHNHENGGTIIVYNTRFMGNNAKTGGAIYTGGNLTVTNSNFTDNNATHGGAIYNYNGTLTVDKAVFDNNTADRDGGAISNGGNLSVTNTRFANNEAYGLYMEDDEIIGGYMMVGGYGGAISNGGTGNLTVNNTVFEYNHADNYGGAIDSGGNLTVTNTQFMGNHADWWGGAIYYTNGSYNITDTSFNNDTPANFIINQDNYIELEETGNYINVSYLTLIVDGVEVLSNVELGQLSTYTIPEGNHLVKLIVNGTNMTNNEYILSDTIDVTSQNLIDAIEDATMDMTIKLVEGLAYNITETITLDKPGITITIDGSGQTMNGMQTQVFHIYSGSTLILKDITITNAEASRGGAIYNEGNLTIINSTLQDNQATTTAAATGDDATATANGGAIYNLYGSVTITGSTLEDNQATAMATGDWQVNAHAHGGAIYNTGNLTITDSTLQDNQANATATATEVYTTTNANTSGGAIYNHGTLTITSSILANNTADNGGAIENSMTLTITQTTLNNNTAEYGGGAISNMGDSQLDATINITTTNFTENHANIGATIYCYNTYVTGNINNNTFTRNTADNQETIILMGDTTTIKDNKYANNTINDTIELNIPTRIYEDQPTTITGTYTINNPENYDPDITEKAQFDIYIDGEFYQTVDTLEFTITPTSDNTIITVQSTTSQTIKSSVINATTINFTLEDVTAVIGEPTQLIAQITITVDDENVEVNTGRVYFKANGKTLRDADTGRILYADVTDNTATLDYNVPKSWNNETTIEAVYTGNDELPKIISETITPTITTPEVQEAEFTVEDVTTSIGEEVTITVTTKNLDGGKVVLKVNGKTVKASDGKLYAKVTGDTLTFTYTVPKTYKAGNYAIKAVYSSGDTKLEADATLTVG